MFIILKQHIPGEKSHGEPCSCDVNSVVAIGTVVEFNDDNMLMKFTRILFKNKETIDVQESVEAMVDLFSKIGR